MTFDIKVILEISRTGRIIATIVYPSISNTGHEIEEDCGRYSVKSIFNGNLLCHNATHDQAVKDIGMEWLAFAAAHTPETIRDLEARFDDLPPGRRMAEMRLRGHLAEKALRPMLKAGDRLRANKAECGAKEANFIFSHWERGWIVSTGGSSIAPGSVYSINHEIFRV